MLQHYGRSDHERAIEIADTLPDSPGKTKGMQKAVSRWAQQESQAAAEWVAQLPEGEGRDYAAKNLVDAWRRFDPQATTEWITSLTDSSLQRVAVEDFVRAHAAHDGAAAWKLAEVIEPPEDQHAVQALILTDWAERHPEAAATALSELPSIPPDLQLAYDKAIETRRAWEAFFESDSSSD